MKHIFLRGFFPLVAADLQILELAIPLTWPAGTTGDDQVVQISAGHKDFVVRSARADAPLKRQIVGLEPMHAFRGLGVEIGYFGERRVVFHNFVDSPIHVYSFAPGGEPCETFRVNGEQKIEKIFSKLTGTRACVGFGLTRDLF